MQQLPQTELSARCLEGASTTHCTVEVTLALNNTSAVAWAGGSDFFTLLLKDANGVLVMAERVWCVISLEGRLLPCSRGNRPILL